VVKHSTLNPMIEGSNPNAGIGRDIKLSVCTLFNSMFAHRSPVTSSVWRQDTQHNSTKNIDTQHSIMKDMLKLSDALSIIAILSVVMLSVEASL
jgi:hypothetical protein